jgi:hypothetical protein
MGKHVRSVCDVLQSQQQVERDIRHMESVQQGMEANNDPLASHFAGQLNVLKQRVDQLGDLHIGYTTAMSVRAAFPEARCDL